MSEQGELDKYYSKLPEGISVSETVEKLVSYAVQEAQARLLDSGECIPFTVMLEGEDLYFETHPADSPQECRESAERTVRTAGDAIESHAFCYDGFLELGDGEHDAIIVEACDLGEETLIFCDLYTETDSGDFVFEEEVALVEVDSE